jgi:hypothetical protein
VGIRASSLLAWRTGKSIIAGGSFACSSSHKWATASSGVEPKAVGLLNLRTCEKSMLPAYELNRSFSAPFDKLGEDGDGAGHLCLPLFPWITTYEAAHPSLIFEGWELRAIVSGPFACVNLAIIWRPRRLGLTNNAYSVGVRGTHLSKIAKGGAASVVHGLEAALRSARRFRPVRAFGGGASWGAGPI